MRAYARHHAAVAVAIVLALVCLASAPPASAQSAGQSASQSASAREERFATIARQIGELLTSMETNAQAYPKVLEGIRTKRESADKAGETITRLITELKQATERMDDRSEFSAHIKAVEADYTKLIDEAQASNDAAIKALVPNMEARLAALRAADARRATTIIEARNLVRDFEDGRRRLEFMVRANALSEAVDLLSKQVTSFAEVVSKGKQVMKGIAEASAP